MNKITRFPIGHKQADYLAGKDARLMGTWFSGDMAESLPAQVVTTKATVVRAWVINGETVHTVERWEHDNGYRAEFSVISKAEFLSLIRA